MPSKRAPAPAGGAPPPPPPPPAAMPPPPKTPGRGALLSSIQKGAKLRHTVTVDKSAPDLKACKPGAGGGGGGGGPMGINPGAVQLRKTGGGPPGGRPSPSLARSAPGGPPPDDDTPSGTPPPAPVGGMGDLSSAILGARLRRTGGGPPSPAPAPSHPAPAPMSSVGRVGRGAPPPPPPLSAGRGMGASAGPRAPAASRVGRPASPPEHSAPAPAEDNSAELHSKINELTAELERVQQENAELKDRVASLEEELRQAKAAASASSKPAHKPSPVSIASPASKPAPKKAPAMSSAPKKPAAPPPPPEPEPEPQLEGKEFRALYDFEAQQEGDLGFRKGDIILVIKQEGSWWEGVLNGVTGAFPNNYVAPV